MATAQLYSYARASALTDARELDLQTSGGTVSALAAPAPAPSTQTPATQAPATPAQAPATVAHPRFFSGMLGEAEPAAAGLIALANVAAAHYYRRIPIPERDPVITCDGERLRMESFSGCCGVYARLDVLPEAIDGDHLARGTTNIDVNEPLRRALTKVRGADPLRLEIGPDEVAVTTLDDAVVERKVPLPGRWLRGFAEVQAIASAGFEPKATLGRIEATRFLSGLPAGGRAALWAVPAGRSLRLTSRPVPGAVALPDPARLKELISLLRLGGSVTVYGPPVAAGAGPVSSCWQLDLPGMRLSLTLSPQGSRGFSGEGAVLGALAADDVAEDAERIGALLDFQGRIEPDELAEITGLDRARVRAALGLLGTSGRVGFDPAEAAFFHRELPFDAARALKDNPRLASAYVLLDAGAVRPEPDGAGARVASGDGSHLVRFAGADPKAPALSCTCAWWAGYRGGRGPCKHILAAGIRRREGGDVSGSEE